MLAVSHRSTSMPTSIFSSTLKYVRRKPSPIEVSYYLKSAHRPPTESQTRQKRKKPIVRPHRLKSSPKKEPTVSTQSTPSIYPDSAVPRLLDSQTPDKNNNTPPRLNPSRSDSFHPSLYPDHSFQKPDFPIY